MQNDLFCRVSERGPDSITGQTVAQLEHLHGCSGVLVELLIDIDVIAGSLELPLQGHHCRPDGTEGERA